MKTELVLGCGEFAKKRVWKKVDGQEYQNPVRLDINPLVKPDVLYDIGKFPLPFKPRHSMRYMPMMFWNT